jgi:hypothetical protein
LLYSKFRQWGTLPTVQEAPSDLTALSKAGREEMGVGQGGPTMTIAPFLALKLRGKKDAVLARQRARRVASILSFNVHEQACIAAGTFVVACQALMLFGKARLCFQIHNQQLQIFVQDVNAEADHGLQRTSKRLLGMFPEVDPKTPFRLTKPLPPQLHPAEEVELGWLVNQVEETASNGLFDEIVKQNQEILSLLHELRSYQMNLSQKEEKSPNPNAA